jgi:two-component system, OmpR family, response regulator QseB
MHCLLVEGDMELGSELQRELRGHGLTGAWVRTVQLARSLTTDVSEGHFASVVLDLELADGQGTDLLQGWRGAGQSLPVIAITAREGLGSRVAVLDSGAVDYLGKSVAPIELASRIRAVTQRATGQSSSEWDVGRLRINTAQHGVQLDGDLMALSPREFQILAELARHAGEVAAKHCIARSIAPLGDPLEFCTLKWHVHNLRCKLGETTIRTIRGVGYTFGEA